jgi:hypothetical protein
MAVVELLIARNPGPDSRLPYLLRLPLGAGWGEADQRGTGHAGSRKRRAMVIKAVPAAYGRTADESQRA